MAVFISITEMQLITLHSCDFQ